MAIKTTRWSPDTCSCVIEYTWDDAVPQASRVHSLDSYITKCVAHASLSTDTDRWNCVLEENPRKNFANQTVLDNGPSSLYDLQQDGSRTLKNGITLNWTWSGTAPNRVLTISYTGITLTTNQKTQAQNWLNNRFGVGKVILA